jgi:hypothetical protein
VGIDGNGDGTVEQVGTDQIVVNGHPFYRAWWEMYSTGIGQPGQVIANMTVEPGDSITASVQYIDSGPHAGEFDLSIVDNSRPNDSFSTYQTSAQTQSPLAQRQCAEWIVEAPTAGGQIATPATFRQVTFSDASAVIDGVSGPIGTASWQSQPLNLVSNGVNYYTTSGLTATGSSFVVTDDPSAPVGDSTTPAVVSGGSQHHGKRLHHALGHAHRSHKKASGHGGASFARNETPVLSGPRTPILRPQRRLPGLLVEPPRD